MSVSPCSLSQNQQLFIRRVCDLYDRENQPEPSAREANLISHYDWISGLGLLKDTLQPLEKNAIVASVKSRSEKINKDVPGKIAVNFFFNHVFDNVITNISKDELRGLIDSAKKAEENSPIFLRGYSSWKFSLLKVHKKAQEILNHPVCYLAISAVGWYIFYRLSCSVLHPLQLKLPEFNSYIIDKLGIQPHLQDFLVKRNAFLESAGKLTQVTGKILFFSSIGIACLKWHRFLLFIGGGYLTYKVSTLALDFFQNTYILGWIPYLIHKIVISLTPEKVFKGVSGFVDSTSFYYENIGNITLLAFGAALFVKLKLWRLFPLATKTFVTAVNLPRSIANKSINFVAIHLLNFHIDDDFRIYKNVNERMKNFELVKETLRTHHVWMQLTTRSI